MEEINTMEEKEGRAVPSPSFWLSQANTEYGQNGWASNIMLAAGIAIPGHLSNLAGTFAGQNVTVVRNGNMVGFASTLNWGSRFGDMQPRNIPIMGAEVTEFCVNNGNTSWINVVGANWIGVSVQATLPNGAWMQYQFVDGGASGITTRTLAGDATHYGNSFRAYENQVMKVKITRI